MNHVFISYSAKDEAYALMLNDELRRQGFDTWIAKHDIPPGTRWEHAIPPAIEACEAFIVIMTPDAYESEWVLNECDLAHTLKKPPFPVLLDGEVFFRYRSRQFEDVRDKSLPTASFYTELGKVIPRARQVQRVLTPPPDIALPPPFAWCAVQAGKVSLEYPHDETQTVVADGFYIAKYPITNAQFGTFIDAGGYHNDAFWTVDGREQRDKNQRRAPRYWDDSRLNGADNPVVGVAWYEALAFCLWLDEQVNPSPLSPPHRNREGRLGTVVLPSERQWQRAAQGDDGRLYPWGDQWDVTRCNVSESGIGKPTPVTQYPNGASPYGVLDMSGNVWEWCLTRYEERDNFLEGTDTRVLRGGSFLDDAHRARVAARFNDFPFDGDTNIGFRVVWGSSTGIEE